MMTEVRKIVLAGEVIGDTKKNKYGFGTFEEDGKIISKFVGIPKESNGYISVIPFSGVYVPKRHDKIIGFITSVERVGWTVDINSPWLAFLSLSEGVEGFVDLKKTDITRFHDIGDVVYAEVQNVKRSDIQLTMNTPMARKLKGGITVKISPSKVPRLIGKEGSMINTIKDKTKTIIRVGQNGVVWVSGEDVKKAIKAIRMVDEKSHIIGLTDEITKFLSD
jgi:exosome complex component RRP4